jgi:hypothetical protein
VVKHYFKEMNERRKVNPCTLLCLFLDEDEWSASYFWLLNPCEMTPRMHCERVWWGPEEICSTFLIRNIIFLFFSPSVIIHYLMLNVYL